MVSHVGAVLTGWPAFGSVHVVEALSTKTSNSMVASQEVASVAKRGLALFLSQRSSHAVHCKMRRKTDTQYTHANIPDAFSNQVFVTLILWLRYFFHISHRTIRPRRINDTRLALLPNRETLSRDGSEVWWPCSTLPVLLLFKLYRHFHSRKE